jgi:hypothetical protein
MPPIDDDVANFMSPERAEFVRKLQPLRPLVPRNGVQTGARIRVEAGTTGGINFHCSCKVRAGLGQIAAERDSPVSDVVNEALVAFLKRNGIRPDDTLRARTTAHWLHRNPARMIEARWGARASGSGSTRHHSRGRAGSSIEPTGANSKAPHARLP